MTLNLSPTRPLTTDHSLVPDFDYSASFQETLNPLSAANDNRGKGVETVLVRRRRRHRARLARH